MFENYPLSFKIQANYAYSQFIHDINIGHYETDPIVKSLKYSFPEVRLIKNPTNLTQQFGQKKHPCGKSKSKSKFENTIQEFHSYASAIQIQTGLGQTSNKYFHRNGKIIRTKVTLNLIRFQSKMKMTEERSFAKTTFLTESGEEEIVKSQKGLNHIPNKIKDDE